MEDVQQNHGRRHRRRVENEEPPLLLTQRRVCTSRVFCQSERVAVEDKCQGCVQGIEHTLDSPQRLIRFITKIVCEGIEQLVVEPGSQNDKDANEAHLYANSRRIDSVAGLFGL